MKTKEQIEEMAKEEAKKIRIHGSMITPYDVQSGYEKGFIEAYTQAQQDLINEASEDFGAWMNQRVDAGMGTTKRRNMYTEEQILVQKNTWINARLSMKKKILEVEVDANNEMVSFQNSLSKTYGDKLQKLQKLEELENFKKEAIEVIGDLNNKLIEFNGALIEVILNPGHSDKNKHYVIEASIDDDEQRIISYGDSPTNALLSLAKHSEEKGDEK